MDHDQTHPRTQIERNRSGPASDEDRPPSRIGKYNVLERIGRGGFGDVFLGRDTVIKRPVAIKVCTSAEAALKQRFFREAEIAGRLRHPNITTIHDTGSFGESPYLVQEYLPGEDLAQLIERHHSTPLTQRLDYLIQIARGLEHAHQQGVVHRDVKPSNIRLLDDGGVKILDFGVARLLGAKKRLTLTGMRIGTVCYMAPEQLRCKPADARADLFSFGVLAFELLTSVHPFKVRGHSMMYQILEFEPLALRDVWPTCPKRLARCVMRCLEKDAGDRFADMSEVLSELEQVELQAPRMVPETQITQVRQLSTAPRYKRRWRMADGARWAAVVLAVALAGLGAFHLGRSVPPMRVGSSPAPPTADPTTPTTEPLTVATTADAAIQTPTPLAETVPPILSGPSPEPAGVLSINALPWASIVRIVDLKTGENVPLPSRYTPLSLVVPPGAYTVALARQGLAERNCRLDVGSSASASCLETFDRIKSRKFFERYDRGGRPGQGPPPGQRPPGGGDPRHPPHGGLGGGSRPEVRPTWLRKMAQAFFDGQYQETLTILDERKKPPKGRDAFYAVFLRGASRHALFLLDGEQTTALSEAAIQDLRDCRRHDPAFVPHPDFFSPRFIEFFSVKAAP